MLGILILWLAVYLTGLLMCKLGGEKEASQLWIHLTGFFFLLFSQGAVFTAAGLLGLSHSRAAWLLALVLGLAALLALIVCRKELSRLLSGLRKGMAERKNIRWRYPLLLLWLWLGIFLVMSEGWAGNRQDAVLETMQTTLATDTMNQFHPFTGQRMEQGLILSRKALTLPFWYAALARWTGFSAQDSLWVWGSFMTLTFSLMAFGELASVLFRRDKAGLWWFMFVLELLLLSGDYAFAAAGYQFFYYGYAGETIVGAVALPALLTALYRLTADVFREEAPLGKKERMALWGALLKLGLVMGASLFLAVPFRGIGLLVLGGFLFFLGQAGVGLFRRLRKRVRQG